MHLPLELAFFFLAAVIPLAQAQTYTSCDPLKSTCPPDTAMKSGLTTDFKTATGTPAGWHTIPCQGKINYGGSASMVIAAQGDCPTLETDDYFLFGYVEVKMKASPGQGIVSSIVLQSDVRDEVDWEFIGGENYRVQSNYFGKADTSTYDRMIYVPVTDPQNQYHTYAVNWTSSAITWLVNGAPVRTLSYADAKGGTRFPQTPMRFRLGIWAGGDPKGNEQGTITWAGGLTDFSKAPFTMSLDSVKIVNYSPANQYRYKDNSGSWQSIEVIGGSVGGVGGAANQIFAQQPSISSSAAGVISASAVSTGAAQSSKAVPTTSAIASVSKVASQSATALSANNTASSIKPSAASDTVAKSTVKPATAVTNGAKAGNAGIHVMAVLSVVSAVAAFL